MHDTKTKPSKPQPFGASMKDIAAARIQAAARPRKSGVGNMFRIAAKKAGLDHKNGALSEPIAAPEPKERGTFMS